VGAALAASQGLTAVLYRIARFCIAHRVAVLAVWIAGAVALVVVSQQLGDKTTDDLSLPGTDSEQATDALDESFPAQAHGTSPIVLHAPGGGKLTDSKYSDAVKQAADAVAKAPHVASVVSPLTTQGAGALSKNQQTGYLSVGLDEKPGKLSVDDGRLTPGAARRRSPGPSARWTAVRPRRRCR
jgi:RND superfamily putative drug exporter